MPIYSYAELKGKIKVGDRVRAAKGRNNICPYLDYNKQGVVSHVDSDGFVIANGCVHSYGSISFLELLTEEKTLDTVDVGDVVVGKRGDERTILDKSPNGTVLFLSWQNDPTRYYGGYTRQQLKALRYTVKQSTPVPETKEMTLEEVSKALGYPVKIVE